MAEVQRATPLDQLPAQTGSAGGDNDNIVQNILSDLEAQNNDNKEAEQVQQQQTQQYQQQQFDQSQIPQNYTQPEEYEEEEEYYEEEPEVQLTFQDRMMQMLKEPGLVTVFFLLLTSDYAKKTSISILERFVKNPNYVVYMDMGLRAILCGILFYVVKNLI